MAVNAEQNQQYNQNQDQQQQGPSTGGGVSQTPAGSGAQPAGRVANYSSGTQAGTSGSGRFTNLNKYINANQGAGDRLAQGIGQKVNTANQTAQKEADTNAASVREGIQSAQNKINTGNQFKDQLNSQDFNAQDIAGDQAKLQDFTNYRTGQAIDENALAQQNQQAQTNYLNLQNQIQNQLNQTATDTGRYQLLKSAFGGGSVYQNPYSTGQQRLDQLFLQSGGSNGIGQLQNNLRQSNVQAGNQLNALSGQAATDIGNIKTQEADLANALQTGATDKTNKFVSDVEATADQVNKDRLAEQNYIQDQYNRLNSGQSIDQRFADMMGLSQGQNLYNSLVGKNANDFFTFNPTNLSGFGQLANTQQEQYYDALAKLSGVTPAYTFDGDPKAASQFNTGAFDDELAANNALTEQLRGKNVSGNYSGRLAGGQASGALTNIMDQLAKQQGINFDTITKQNTNSNIADYLMDPSGNQYDGGRTLDANTKSFLDSLRPHLNASNTYNNASHYVDETGAGARAAAQQAAILQALQQLQDVNYFNRVNIGAK